MSSRKSLLCILLVFICIASYSIIFAKEVPYGIDLSTIDPNSPNSATTSIKSPIAFTASTTLPFSSYVYTTNDLIFFSYADGTELEVYDSSGNPVSLSLSVLDKGQHVYVDTSDGVYFIAGSHKFAVLTGDAPIEGATGYYAINEEGRGTATEFYTYVPKIYNHCEFIVFAYEDGVNVTVQQDSSNGSYSDIASFTLDKGQHWSISSLAKKYLHVVADGKVSALTCYDQSYFVPSTDGLWSGKEFHTYINDISNWEQDITVIAYYDNTAVTMTDSDSQSVLWQGTLNSGQEHTLQYSEGADKYISVITDKTSTVSVQAWKSLTDGYNQGTFVPDESGFGIGLDLIGSTLDDGYMYVLGYTDNTNVTVYNPLTGVRQSDYIINAGEAVNVNPGNGLWKVVSDEYVVVNSGWGGKAVADFSPMQFHRYSPELIKTDDVAEGSCRSPGDDIEYEICFTNTTGQTLYDACIVDILPDGVEYNYLQSFPSIDPNYNEPNHVYTWYLGDIEPEESGCVNLTVTAGNKIEPGGYLLNTAELWADNGSIRMARDMERTPVCCWGDDPNVIYVDLLATGSNTGTSWQDAYVDLADALLRTSNNYCSPAYAIYVAQGTYNPENTADTTFELPDNCSVYGGFRTGGSEFSKRNPQKYETILTGLIDEDTIPDVTTIVEMGNDCLLDGCTVEYAYFNGHCIYGDSVDFTVNNCVVQKSFDYGIYAEDGNVTVTWCTVRNNNRDGIRHDGENYELTLENSWVLRNGEVGIHCWKSTPTAKNSIISESGLVDNSLAGVRLYRPTYAPVLRNCTIANNRAEAISFEDDGDINGDTNNPDWPNVQNCILYFNNDGGKQLDGKNGFHPDRVASYCCIYDCNEVNNNHNDVPGFAYLDPADPNATGIPDPNNYHLASDSFCKDKGNPYLSYTGETDYDAEARVLDSCVDIGADEIDPDCSDVVNDLDWNTDGIINLKEFNEFSKVWLSHDPDDPALTDPNNPLYDDFNDPNSVSYVDPNNLVNWDEKCNVETFNSPYTINMYDLMEFVDNGYWLWIACWKLELLEDTAMASTSGASTMSLMSTASVSMLPARSVAIEEETVEEQATSIQESLNLLNSIWLTDEELRNNISQQDWDDFISSIETSLNEIQSGF